METTHVIEQTIMLCQIWERIIFYLDKFTANIIQFEELYIILYDSSARIVNDMESIYVLEQITRLREV